MNGMLHLDLQFNKITFLAIVREMKRGFIYLIGKLSTSVVFSGVNRVLGMLEAVFKL